MYDQNDFQDVDDIADIPPPDTALQAFSKIRDYLLKGRVAWRNVTQWKYEAPLQSRIG